MNTVKIYYKYYDFLYFIFWIYNFNLLHLLKCSKIDVYNYVYKCFICFGRSKYNVSINYPNK